MALDAVQEKSAREYQEQFQETLLGVSGGVLSDFSASSVLTLLSEVYGLGFGGLNANINEKIEEVIFSSIAKLFGSSEVTGTRTQVIVSFFPDRIDTIATYRIDSYFQFTINGVPFQTDQEVSVPPGSLFSSVTATAINVGVNNFDLSSGISWESVPGLANIAFKETITPGTNAQTFQNVSTNLTTLLVNQALITTSDYEGVITRRFPELVLRVLPNLDRDKLTVKPGVIHVFASNKNLTPVSPDVKAQITNLLSEGWAIVYVSDFTLMPLKISVIGILTPGSGSDSTAALIRDKLINEFLPGNREPGEDIDLNDTIGSLYSVPGVRSISYLGFDTGDNLYQAMDIPVQNLFTLVNLIQIKVEFTGVSNPITYIL
jgi:hypothetical protein